MHRGLKPGFPVAASQVAGLHVFERFGQWFVFDPVSITPIQIDGPMAEIVREVVAWAQEVQTDPETDVLDWLEERVEVDCLRAELYAEFKRLLAYRLLGVPDDYFRREGRGKTPAISHLVLQVAQACNMSCGYCFADGGNYGGANLLMTWETAQSALDFMVAHWAKGAGYHITFFGGEPMLNFPVIKQVVDYVEERARADGRECSFGMTTNGTLLTPEAREYLEAHNFGLILSHDGTPELHNEFRILNNGAGSYDKILKNLRAMKGTRLARSTTLRGSYVASNPRVLERAEHLQEFVRDGFARAFTVEPAALVSQGCTDEPDQFRFPDDGASTGEDFEELGRRTLQALRRGEPLTFTPLSRAIRRLIGRTRVTHSCGAGRGYVEVDPHGNIHACHRQGPSGIGNTRDGFDHGRRNGWLHNTIYDRDDCPTCWARYLCGGGCRFDNEALTGDPAKVWKVYCHREHTVTELAIWIISQLDLATLDRIANTKMAPAAEAFAV